MSNNRKVKSSESPKTYSLSFKYKIVEEFESGLYSKAALQRKYSIAGHSTIDRWLRKYGKLSHPKYKSIGRPMKDKEQQRIKELEASLRKREKELEKALKQKDAELSAYKKFIKIAERELDIKIVKKSGTKQFKK